MSIRKLPSLDTMERIPQAHIPEKLDEIFERINKENIGLVITGDGKDQVVLCPFDWFDFSLDDGFGRMVNSAIRDELSHPSKNTEAVQSFVRNHCGSLDLRTVAAAVEDIECALQSQLRTLEDPRGWTALRDLLCDRLCELESKKGGQDHEWGQYGNR